MIYFTDDTLKFLKQLKKNNNREWFAENKKRYEKSVKEPYQKFIEDLIGAMSEHLDGLAIAPKDAIFRIYRDVRFSKDKSPYKTKVSALVTPGGRKDMKGLGIYNELSSEDFRIYSGLYQLDSKQLQSVRTHISYNLDEFNSLITNKDFVKTFGSVQGEQNKRIPKEFIEDAEKQPLLYNKSFYYFAKFGPETVLKKGLIDKIINTFLVAKPVSEFLIEGLEG